MTTRSPVRLPERPVLLWGLLLGATGLVFGLAVLPPFVGPEVRVVLREAFSPLCHQLPARSPHLFGVPLAVGDRCIGIYAGLVLGVAMVGVAMADGRKTILKRLPGLERLGVRPVVLLGLALVPAALDWLGPWLDLWGNGPASRCLTGLVAGLAAGAFVAGQFLRAAATPLSAGGREG